MKIKEFFESMGIDIDATKPSKVIEFFHDVDTQVDLDELYNDPNGNRGNGETNKNRVAGTNINEVSLMSSENPVKVSGVETTTNGVNTVGQKDINVNGDLTWDIQVWDSIAVNFWDADEIVYTVNSITASKITTLENIIYEIPNGADINKVTLEWADILSTNPKNVIVWIQTDMVFETERVAPDGYNFWYKMKLDILVENPEATAIVKDLKIK